MFKKVTLITVVALAALVGLLRMEVWAGVVVNEIMPDPAGGDSQNEYIELHNTGSGPINVANWTFSDGTGSDTIDSGSVRNLNIPGCDTTTTVIPSDSYAVILDPDYMAGGMPYAFPAGTIILTINSDPGDSVFGSGGLGNSDTITLSDSVGATISTYGVYVGGPPTPSANVSVERIDPGWLDVACNWAENTTSDSTPGAINSVDADYTGSDPTAQFTVAPSASGTECQTFTFTDQSDSDGCQDITAWLWDFGDGDTSADSNTSHCFNADTVCTVTLTVTDSGGDTSDTQMVITTSSADPFARFTVAPSASGTECQTFTFTDQSDSDGCQDITAWLWDFGDGDTSADSNTSHCFNADTVCTVTLTVTDSGGDTSDTQMVITTSSADPFAGFTVAPSASGTECQTFTFTDQSDSDGCQDITAWLWDFGDGNTSTDSNTSHCFNTDTICTVTLTVEDSGGDTHDTQMVIATIPADPTAKFTTDGNWVSSASDSECHTFTFNANISDSDGCQSIDTYTWSFGDGNVGSGMVVSHSYDADTTCTVTLTVKDSGGDTHDTQVVITTTSVNPQAEAGPDTTSNTFTVDFDGSGTTDGCQPIDTWTWDFGDGDAGTGQSTTHTYSNAGTYTVTLTVTDSGGDTDSDTLTVVVSPSDDQKGASLHGPGSMIVWEDERNGNGDIYLYDLGPNGEYENGGGDDGGEFQITTNGSAQQEPDVWVNPSDTAFIVWTDFRNSVPASAYGDIYYARFDTGTKVTGETRLTTDPWHQAEPVIYGDTIVYTTTQNGANVKDLYYYNITTGDSGPLATGGGNQSNADIFGDTVVYQDDGGVAGQEKIWVKTNGTTQQIGGTGRQTNPAIDSADGRYVAYQSYNGTDWDIYVYDLNTGSNIPVAISTANEENPSVNSGKVAYQKEGSSNIFVYYINGGTTYQVTNYTGVKEAAKPTIYVPTVAWQERDNQNDDWEIAFHTLPDPDGDTPPGDPAAVTEADTCSGSDLDYICTGTYYVHWTAPVDTSPSGISHYVIEESIDSGAWANLGTTTNTCYLITGKSHSKFYRYRVRSVSNSGAESDSVPGDGIRVDTTCAITPGTPIEGDSACVGIDSDWDGDGTYQVSWPASSDPESGIESYELQERVDTGAWTTINATIAGDTTCTSVSGRLHGHTYYYRVRAGNRAGCACGDWSDTSDGITIDTAPVTPPSSVVEGDNACQREDEDFDADGNYWVSWNPTSSLSDITAYELAQCTDALAWTTLADTITDTCYQVTGNSHNDTYYYRVRAGNGADTWSGWSDTSDGITVDSTDPPCPPNITLENGADFTYENTYLSATWDTPADPQGTPIAGYQYALGTSPGDNSVLDWSDTTDTGVTVTGLSLTNGQTYYFSVRARNYLGLWGNDCSDSITVYLNEWTIVFPAAGSATSHCTAGVNPAATAGFDPGLDVPAPPIPAGGEYVVVYFDHPEYPDTATRMLETDIRKKTEPLEDFKDTWPICIIQNINIQGHNIELRKPNFVDVPISLDVVIRDNVTGEVKYLQFNGVNLNTSDTVFSFDSNLGGPERCYTLMVSGSDSTPDESDWIAENRDTFPADAGQDDDYDTDGLFYVAWENTGATEYELQQDSGAGWVTVQTDTITTYTETGGVLGTRYEHRVRAIDSDGFYSYWTTAATITVDSTPPTVPGKPWTTPSGYSDTGNYTVCWDGATDPESGVCTYTLRESSDGGAAWPTEYDTPDTCYNITGKADGDYIYQVRAINCAGLRSDYSDTSDSLTVDTTAPDSPANVWEGDYACGGDDSDGDEDGNYWVAWGASADSNPVVAYRLWEGKAGQPGWATVADTITDTCHQVTGRDSGTYYYRVQAQDAAGNWGDTSSASDGISVAGATTDYCHQFGAGWSLVSIPVDPTYADPEESFPCLDYGTCWLIGYQTNTGYFYDDSLALGEGYWLGLNSSDTFCFLGTPLLASPSDSYSIPINAGWNLIGCPYPLDRTNFMIRNSATGEENTIADALAAGWIPLDKFYEFDPLISSYVAMTTLRPYYGYWFGSLIDGELLVMDIRGPSAPFPGPSLIKEGELLVKITVSGGRVAATGGIGLSPLAEEGLDPEDSLLPPDPKGDYINLYTNHPEERIFSRFALDVRKAISHRQMEEFEFMVETNLTNTKITLSWNPSDISKEYRAILVDQGERIDMKRASSYSYNSGQGIKTFRIEATRKAPAPSQMSLSQNYPNPFNPETWIPFKLDDDAKVEFRIYTITGQLIRTINCGYREAGEYVANDHGTDKDNLDGWGACYWDGYNNSGQEVASGVYFYQLVADGKVLTKKMVVLK